MALGATPNPVDGATKRLRWPLRLTRAGMVAEQVLRSFWPMLTVIMLVLAALMFAAHEVLPLELVWGLSVLAILAMFWSVYYGVKHLHWPSKQAAQDRLDKTLPGRPIQAITDQQVIGAGDAASQEVWRAHIARMAKRAEQAKAPPPDLQISRRDPFALRYVAALSLAMALIFGSILKVATVADIVGQETYATGPAWEGWIEPPAYTGKPSIYLADVNGDTVQVPQNSHLTVRLYGEVGALSVAETVSGWAEDIESAAASSQDFDIDRSGTLSINGDAGGTWNISIIPDTPPAIRIDGEVERGTNGEMRLPFAAQDDYGVISARAVIELDLAAVDRRFGLALPPEQRETIPLDLPMPIRGGREDFVETINENLAQHPWATLPVKVTLYATDAANQVGQSEPQRITLPGRRFFDPLAGALIEQRRDILWNRKNGPHIAQVLRAISYQSDDVFHSHTAYLKLRIMIRRMERSLEHMDLSDERRDEIAQTLWDIATLIEDGSLSDAKERLRRAQERLSEAMEQGATDEEIAKLMDELREAMQDYMAQLAEQQDQDQNQQAENQEMQEITGDQLQEMLERLQELMEQGRMEEAQALLDQLAEMMENMQVTQGQSGQGQQSPGQEAMQGLADTLRQQQGLNDETFGDAQGQQDGEEGQQGQQGQQGQGAQGGQDGQGGQGGQQPGQGQGQSLADRQQALRDQLNQQSQNLPGQGTPGGDAARDALGRAGRAMDGAEQALRDQDYAGALDDQSQALEALRDGMRELAEQMAQEQQNQQGQQGNAVGQANNQTGRDPLGRESSANGRPGTENELLQGEDVYRRARELLDEIRKRSADQERPDVELEYLKRLLDRF